MKLHGNAFSNFIAAATAVVSSTNQQFVLARIGNQRIEESTRHQRHAPIRKGYNPTAPVVIEPSSYQQQQQPRRRSSSSNYHHYDRPGTESIDETLKIRMEEVRMYLAKEAEEKEHRIQNATAAAVVFNETSSSSSINNNDDDDDNVNEDYFNHHHPDTGLLKASPSGTPTTSDDHKQATITTTTTTTTKQATAASTATSDHTTTTEVSSSITDDYGDGTCMIGYYGKTGDKRTVPVPANEYLHDNMIHNVRFDSESNTVYCDQAYDPQFDLHGCAHLKFTGCDTVKCTGDKSCFKARIDEATRVVCEGEEACHGAHLDATTIICGGERSCQSSYIGDILLVATLDCNAHESCSWASTYQVNDVHCHGPAACYGAYMSGIESKVTCQSTSQEEGYYSPTCGGDKSFIEAADGHDITVTCSGDFSCIGYGHDADYDDDDVEMDNNNNNNNKKKQHPVYFDIDVGKNGELICENSLIGNHDGGTYVCRYIDIIQGCANYNCHEPKGFNVENDYRTCNHIFSIHHHELCYEGPGGGNDDDDDEFFVDDVDVDDTTTATTTGEASSIKS